MSGQSISIGALLLSCLTYWSLLFGVPACVILQVAWCCPMKKGGLVTAGVFGAIAGVICIVQGVFYLLVGGVGASVVGFLAGLAWIGTAVCVFIFSCSNRYRAVRHPEDEENDVEQAVQKNETVSNMAAIAALKNKAVPTEDQDIASVVSGMTGGSVVNKTIIHLPDGSIKTEIETVRPDGSKQVTTFVEHPKQVDE